MLGSSPDYKQDGQDRPQKRARNTSSAGALPYHGSTSVGSPDETTMSIPNEGGRNGRQEVGAAPAASGRGRGDGDKNRKLSCKECRRLKLKCDRVFPCQSCVKRGCGSLCPEGALTSGRGSRFILANTEQLHEKITTLSERVRQLEEALGILQSTCSNRPHPLLAPELLRIKTSQELYGMPGQNPPLQPSPQFDTPGPSQLHSSVDLLSLCSQPRNGESSRAIEIDTRLKRELAPPEVSQDILHLSTAFPFPWRVDMSIRKKIREALPPKVEAEEICEQARRNALWQYNLDASETFLPNLLHYCYNTPIEDLSPRRLALLLMVLSIGSLVDLNQPLGSLHGEAYHHLARAAVCEIPLMEEPDFDVLHALFFMLWYHLIFSDNKKAVGYAWNLMGFVAKLAQGLGLHRDTARLKGIPEEQERRRAIFWELLNLDCRMSLSLGRPPSICLTHVDTKPPLYTGPGIYVPREEIVYHEWKNAFFRECLTPMLEAMVSAEIPAYERILRLDRDVRDFAVPPLLLKHNMFEVQPRFLVMQRGLVQMGRQIALLQLHRKYFTEAMSGSDAFDLHHRYAPSVLATYLGASALISGVEELYKQEEQLSTRFLHFWFNAFSAAVTISLLISRAPSTTLASHALLDLDRACKLFHAAGRILPFSGKALPLMSKLLEKSRRVLAEQAGHDTPPSHPTLSSVPSCFAHVHLDIYQCAERMRSASPSPATAQEYTMASSNFHPTKEPPPGDTQSDSWLPDVYGFASVGLGIDERYTFALSQPTPFVPSSSRVAENANYNFDHGALTAGLVEETSYMAWF
ncbi:hypothetical protein BDQ12DRAFT_682922 [Crucibulum laeve]|uniref:Zn(2)-C6 fungal-type domain-containing protein n=1 Tax=Crucibulum laeve TaxID=68775 RepID=A0A5C3M0Y8_9AGAR|nr:hypothetical protein BDQ12DRAFT_682922 [Crucibulum laeve]